ncbi:protein ACCELERATED CELL DEATH 6-like [Camellia sinensis]|uniref:protein ACCELERATED CELL DEATH 6-like n=1 Tax=Camellia sinensis TaxID=4442 RepID=UPI00103555E7|nr:protein ACCELERATED CELL DEATH 6-like [Camellia sinensis]
MATIPIFDGTNYKIWSVKMKTLLLSMDLWDTVQNGYNHEANGETDEETKKENQKKDAAALSHIQQGVSDRIFPIIEDATTAKQAWRNLLFSTERLYGPDYRNVMTPKDLRQTGANHLIVATLVATVAFTAGFTMPGGYNSNDGLNQGMAILTREAAFKAFMVTDTIAMSLSISAVLIHFYAAITNNPDMLENQVYTAAYLIIFAVVAMVLAFVTGTYAVLAHSSGLAVSVCVIGCLPLFFLLITRIIKNCTDLCANNFIGSDIEARRGRRV